MPASSSPADSVNLLLVDDQPRNLEVLEAILASPDHRLLRATSGDEALLALMREEFAAIVLDVQMPGMSGLELARLIKRRKRNEQIPILFITAHFLTEMDVLEGYGVGAVDYLTKPINPQILKSKVAVFVELFRTNRALIQANAALEGEIARRQEAQEALRRANDELEARVQERTAELGAALKAKDDFLAALSHELRTPLNPALLLASEREEDRSLPASVRDDFAAIRRDIELEARLIDDLLDLTRISHGKLHLELRPVDLHGLLQMSWERLKPEAAGKDIQVSFELAPGAAWVHGDAVRLQQVFLNLLKNAVRFTPAGGQITVRSRATPAGEWWMEIADNGVGIEPDNLDRIFSPFVQGHDGHRSGGLGLGLAISRRLVELHSGRISARSDGAQRGSAFAIELPASAAPAVEAIRRPEVLPPSSPAASHRILLVEDHGQTRATLARLLTQRGHEVATAGSVEEALVLAQTFAFDFVLSDLGLPDGSGHDLISALRKSHPRCRGIALSGYGMESDTQRSLDAGFDLHLTKPVDIRALERALHAGAVGHGPAAR